MNNSPIDMNSFLSEFPLPPSIAADLEALCLSLEKMFAGQPADMAVFAAGLARVMAWARTRTPAEGSSAAVDWSASYAGLSGLGGTITCQNAEQEWMLSMDSSSVVYLGSWRSLRPGEEDRGGLFSIDDSPSGRVLVLDTGQAKQQILLPDSEGLIWGSIDGFLQGIQVEESPQPDAPESQPTPPPPPVQARSVSRPQSGLPKAKRPPAALTTVQPRSPVPQTPPAPLPSQILGKEPMASEQAAMDNPEVWQCSCGSKNSGRFCRECGSEKPTLATGQHSEPDQPTFCRQCGVKFSKNARFCRNCGAEVGR